MDTWLETVNLFVLLFALLLVANANLWVMGPKSLELSLCHFDHFLSIGFTSVEDVFAYMCTHKLPWLCPFCNPYVKATWQVLGRSETT